MIREAPAAALRSWLLADRTIAAAVGSRLRPNQAAPSDALPYAVYSFRVAGGRDPIPSGGLVEYTLEVLIAGDYDQVAALGAAFADRLHQWGGTVGGRVIRGAFLRDEDDDHIDDPGDQIGYETKLQTYAVWVKEGLPAATGI